MRHTHLACDFGRNDALLEQIGGLHTPFLHRGKVASWATRRSIDLLACCFTGTWTITECHTNHSLSGRSSAAYFPILFKIRSLCLDSRDAELGPTGFQRGKKTGASVRRSRKVSNVALRGDNRRGDDWLGLELSQAFHLVRPAQPGERKRAY
jgi:hypothetical protein